MLPTLNFALPLPPNFNSQYFTQCGHHTLTPGRAANLNDNRVVDIHLTKRTTRREQDTLVQPAAARDWLIDAQHPVLHLPVPDAPAALE